jgi:hypothetical protein
MLLLTLHSHYAEGYFPLVDEPIEPYNFVTRSGTIRSPNATAKPRIPQRHICPARPLGSVMGTIFAVTPKYTIVDEV